MAEIKYENNWIDLSGLPRFEGVTKYKNINWQASVGFIVPFCYRSISASAQILGINTKTRRIKIYIDNWTIEGGEEISIQNFQTCNLHKLYNKISVLAPEMIVYLLDKNDAYKYPPYYNDKIAMRCPHCGTIKEQTPCGFMSNGFSCPACGDRVSYPNKLMFNVLTQLNMRFITELSRTYEGFEWCTNYRYDFYFELDSHKYIIEMDGHFHDDIKQKQRDRAKTQLALQHGIDLIRIDCRYDKMPFDYIVKNIHNSKLSDILQLECVNWRECDKYASRSLMRDICEMWEQDLRSVGEIMETYKLSKTTVKNYLLKGNALGLCPSYNKEESRRRASHLFNKHVGCCVNGVIKYVFFNANAVEAFAVQIGAPKFCAKLVQEVCTGVLTTYHGVVFRYVDDHTYEMFRDTLNEQFDIVDFLCQEHNIKPIAVIENSQIIYVFKHVAECSKLSDKLFGAHYDVTSIHRVLLGKQSLYFGKKFKYITLEEYRQYKMISNNNKIIKEVAV